MKITCNYCKNEISTNMYFYNPKIISSKYTPSDIESYKVVASGKCICCVCGNEIRKDFSHSLTSEEMIEIATERWGDTD